MTLPTAIAGLLAEPPFASLKSQGLPLIVGQGAPFRLVWANAAALDLFGAKDEAALNGRLTQANDPGVKRLRDLSGLLSPGATPRLERLRLFKDGQARNFTFLCQRLPAPQTYFIAGALDGPALKADDMQSAPTLPTNVPELVPAIAAIAEPQAQTMEALQASLSQQFPSARRLRFVWQLDDRGQIIQMGSVLSQIIGGDVTQWLGRDFASLLAEQGVEDCAALHQAIAARRTLTGLDVQWPIPGHHAKIAMTLGGVPSFDAQRAYEGFRGFGVVHLDRMSALGEVQPAQEKEAETKSKSSLLSAGSEPKISEGDLETSRNPASNVVRLRQFHVVTKPNATPAQSATQNKPAPQTQSDQLSSQERNAFREIARALGAKIESDETSSPASKSERKNEIDLPAQKFEIAQADHSSSAEVKPDEVKREEVDKSLAKIRDFIEVTLAGAETKAVTEETKIQSSPERIEEAATLLALAANDEIENEANEEANDQITPSQSSPTDRQIDQADDPLSLEANAKALFERLPFGILVTRGAIPILMNQVLLETLGYSDIDAFYEAGGPDRIFESKSTQKGDDQFGSAIPVRRADGHILYFDVRMRMMQWGGDAATLMTFQSSLEAELSKKIRALERESVKQQTESRELHAILDTATDGVIVLDAQGAILSLNQSAQALFGYDQAELLGESFSTVLMPESHAYAQDYLAGLQGNGVASLLNDGREIIGRARQGGAIPIFMTIGRVASGETMKFCAVLRDMTQWKKAERELREARREAERASALKSDFLAKISHEIRTPLHAIMGFAEVIMEERFGPVGNDRYKDYLKDIHASGTHVMSLVNDLLDLSRIEAGKAELNFVAVDANRIVQECVALMQPQALRERVIVRVSLAPNLPKLVADERSLKQIVLNLLSNAVKFNEPGGQVILSTALTDAGNAVIRVKDTGIGMDDEEIQMALEPFRQLATARQSSGTGLGLPLTRALVEANRASFTIRSRKREGTLVEVAFPSPRVLAE